MYMQAYSTIQPPQPLKVIEYGQQLMAKDLKTVSRTPRGAEHPDRAVPGRLEYRGPAESHAGQSPRGEGGASTTGFRAHVFRRRTSRRRPATRNGPRRERYRKAGQDRARRNRARAGEPGAGEKRLRHGGPAVHEGARQYPNNSPISYNLGRALSCEAKANPDKSADFATRAIYEFVRAAAVDPTLGGRQTPRRSRRTRIRSIRNITGARKVSKQLKDQAKASPLPPAGFAIIGHRVVRAQAEGVRGKKPQLALWMGIKGQ